ncbi:MAG: hypothetical protein JWN03_1768 [Nocardia sp.]|uniref:hypothetical protein n=1 Tax=Nocardia sp. TaxID=1821 RepID=UPI002639B707|nr:hypothetical protein [Nocardia sp.]MCU1641493.1 hypothetical protein [Nocardia sp.]
MDIDHCIAQLDSTDQSAQGTAADAPAAEGGKAIPALLRALREVDSAGKSFNKFGPQLVPLLQQVRRSHLPERRSALHALAEIGWHTIEPADLALLHRFIMSQLARETPHIPAATKCLWWALPTDDQAAVLDAFALSDPVPATIAMGTAVALNNRGHWNEGECERVYVSPALDGWTLIFGESAFPQPRDEQRIREEQESDFWKTIMENQSDDLKQAWLTRVSRPSREERCAQLSRRFGAAHWYKEADDYEWGGWCIAENGDTLRHGNLHDCVHERLTLSGDPHPSERGLRAEPVSEWLRDHGFASDAWEKFRRQELRNLSGGDDYTEIWDAQWAEFQRRTGIPDAMTPTRIAERASVGPHTLGPHTRIKGHGVIVLTESGRQGSRHRGALPISSDCLTDLI